MRTTINLDDDLLAAMKRLAQEQGSTLTAVIEDALRERLARRASQQRVAEQFTLHTFTGNGLLPGVDLDDSADLRELMDDPA